MAIPEPRGITIGKGTPQNSEGQNGDMTIRSSIRGLKLYVKESNKWHGIDLDIDLRSLVGTIQRLEKEVKRLSNKTNNIPVVDKVLLRQSGGAAAIGIKNDAGNIALGNGDANVTLESNGNHNLVLQTGNSDTGTITITDGDDADIDIVPAGTGKVGVSSDLNLASGKQFKINGTALAASDVGGITATSTDTLTNKTFDANGTGNSLSNVDMANDVTGTLPAGNGGTGLTSLSANVVTLLGGANFDAVKSSLDLGNVTNESKATMFTNPEITGATDGSAARPVINTSTSNVVKFSYDDNSANYALRIVGPPTQNSLQFYRGAQHDWSVGVLDASDDILRISSNADLTSSPEFSLADNGNLTITGTLAAPNVSASGIVSFGTLTDSGESISILKFVDEADGIGSNDNDTSIPTSAAVKDYVDSYFYDVQLHMFVTTDANQDYLPFGPSNIEGNSTGDNTNDDTLFIPPYNGKLIKLVIHHGSSTGDAGATRMLLRVNGSDKSFVQVTLSNETSATFDFTTLADDQVSFSAGD